MKKLNFYQSGRSMVEMLGVLAIIGVLSVGAIAGYQKAMFKYKMNKTMDIISHAIRRVAELDNMNLGETIYSAEQAIKYGIFPDCDVNYVNGYSEKGLSCPFPLGYITSSFWSFGDKIAGNFTITFNKQPFESCVAFLSSGIYKNVPDSWWYDDSYGGFILVYALGNNYYFYGKSEWVLSEGAKSNPTNQDILNVCKYCENGCDVIWRIRR